MVYVVDVVVEVVVDDVFDFFCLVEEFVEGVELC